MATALIEDLTLLSAANCPVSAGKRCAVRRSDGTIYVLYEDTATAGTDRRLRVSVSSDGGATWSVIYSAVVVAGSGNHLYPILVLDSSETLHLIYYSVSKVYHLTYNGTWSTVTSIAAANTWLARWGAAAGDLSGTVHLAALQTGQAYKMLHYKYSGGAWSTVPETIYKDTAYRNVTAHMYVDPMDGQPACYWHKDRMAVTGIPARVYFMKRTINGWPGIPETVASDAAINQFTVPCGFDQYGNFHALWVYDEGALARLRYRKRLVTGTWEDVEQPAAAIASAWEGTIFECAEASLAVDQAGTINIFHRGWSAAWTPTTFYRTYKTPGGAWNTATLRNGVNGHNCPLVISDPLPRISGARTCLPLTGYAYAWADLDNATGRWQMWFDNDSVTWGTATPQPASVASMPVTLTTESQATLNGRLEGDGGVACECFFQWGVSNEYGAETPPIGSLYAGDLFSAMIGPLNNKVVYHYRAVARNSAGTTYGLDRVFSPLASVLLPSFVPMELSYLLEK